MARKRKKTPESPEENYGKFPVAIGGFVAFLLVFFTALYSGAAVTHALRNAAIGCLIVAWPIRSLYNYMVNAAKNNRHAELRAREAAEEATDEEPQSNGGQTNGGAATPPPNGKPEAQG